MTDYAVTGASGVEQYVDVLQQEGLDQAVARFVAAIDASIARGEPETNRQRPTPDSL